MEANLEEALAEYGVSLGKNSDKTFQKCVKLCEKYSLEAEEFVGTWMAFAATASITEIEEPQLEEFEKQELSIRSKDEVDGSSMSLSDSKLKFLTEKKVEVYSDDSDAGNDLDNDANDVLKMYGLTKTHTGTPKSEKKPTTRFREKASDTPKNNFSPGVGYSPAVLAKSASYEARTKAGDSVLRFKCKDSDYWTDISKGMGCVEITPISSTKSLQNSQTPFKYMFQRTIDMAAALDSIIADVGYHMIKENEMELQDLRESSGGDCWYLGRIRNDDGRLSQSSILLEGEMYYSGGHVVSLDLTGAEEFRLFPGQVVLVKGKNELGSCLRVTEFAPAPVPALPELVSSKIRPINVIVAAGPFTPIDSLQYEPLEDLINVLTKDTPDVCILVGPFIDPSHPLIASGEIGVSFDEYFEQILEKLNQSVSKTNVQIVIVSSCRDANHHAVYPTPSYDLVKRFNKITVLPDPATLEVGGITIGLTSMDILKHLANSEISKSTISDRMGGLSKLVLSQRSFYPLYPPDESVPLDVQLWAKYCSFTTTPHILILPSDLRYFFKEVDGTIVINPERLTKGKSGGTYARFQVKHHDAIGDVKSVADFCIGEIVKI